MMGFFTLLSLSVIKFTPFLLENDEYAVSCSYMYISLSFSYKESIKLPINQNYYMYQPPFQAAELFNRQASRSHRSHDIQWDNCFDSIRLPTPNRPHWSW